MGDSRGNNVEAHSGFVTRHSVPQDQQEQHWHRPATVRELYPTTTSFPQASRQPLPFTDSTEYAEHNTLAPGHHLPRRETVWVD